jgi:hypothetical protein
VLAASIVRVSGANNPEGSYIQAVISNPQISVIAVILISLHLHMANETADIIITLNKAYFTYEKDGCGTEHSSKRTTDLSSQHTDPVGHQSRQ